MILRKYPTLAKVIRLKADILGLNGQEEMLKLEQIFGLHCAMYQIKVEDLILTDKFFSETDVMYWEDIMRERSAELFDLEMRIAASILETFFDDV
uniref:Uncharacterized protein n=1 Tax=Rhizobium phage IG49 TaxID=3129228 RepID=A0AAU8HZB0_9CAUD